VAVVAVVVVAVVVVAAVVAASEAARGAGGREGCGGGGGGLLIRGQFDKCACNTTCESERELRAHVCGTWRARTYVSPRLSPSLTHRDTAHTRALSLLVPLPASHGRVAATAPAASRAATHTCIGRAHGQGEAREPRPQGYGNAAPPRTETEIADPCDRGGA
jgi:hypothetical protein